MAFLIDVLDAAHKPIFRIYYNDAASYPTNEPNKRRWNGHLPPSILREKRIDVALLTGASFSQVKHYPEQLIHHLQPKHTIVIHWEDFFKNPERPLHQVKVVPFTDIDTFVKALQQASPTDAVPSKQAGWTLALPFQTIRFHPPTKR
jgi:hypothetical protein